jgi:hypothetical protein
MHNFGKKIYLFLVSPPFLVLFLVNVLWQMGSNQNANIMSIGNEIKVNVNEMNIEEESVRTLEQNESLQTKNSKVGDNEKRIRINFQKIAFSKKTMEKM